MKKLLLILSLSLAVSACKKDNEPTVENTYYFKVWNKTKDIINVGATIYTKSNPGSPIYNYDVAVGLPSNSQTELVKITTKTPVDIEECAISAHSFFSGEIDWEKFKMSVHYNFIGMDTIFTEVIDTNINNAPMYYLHVKK